MKKQPVRNQRRGGFTLLEVLLVVGILALLAAIVAPRMLGTQKRAQVDVTKSQIAMLDDTLQLYVQQNGSFPVTEQGLEALVREPEVEPLPRSWAGPYLEEGTLIDPWNNPYQYAYPGEHNEDRPDIWSFGPDGEDATEDDIGNWRSTDEYREDEDLGGDRTEGDSSDRSDRGSRRTGGTRGGSDRTE